MTLFAHQLTSIVLLYTILENIYACYTSELFANVQRQSVVDSGTDLNRRKSEGKASNYVVVAGFIRSTGN
jgi:hypothetical protein